MKRYVAKIVLGIIPVLASLLTLAQAPFYKTYTLPGEPAAGQVNCLYQTKKGYILVGATTGVYQFDGISFHKIAKQKNVPNDVTAVFECKDGNIWIGFANGKLGWLKLNQLELQNPEEGLPTKPIKKILQDSAGVIWIATAGEGIYYYTNNRFYNINIDDGLSDNYVYDIIFDGNKSIIAATDRGLNFCTLAGEKKMINKITSLNSALPDNIVKTLAKSDRLYFGMHDAGIGSMGSPISYTNSWTKGPVNAIQLTGKEIWVATEESGLLRGSVEKGVAGNFITVLNSKISSLLKDKEDNIWAAGKDQLIRTNGSRLQQLVALSESEVGNLHTLLVDKEKHLWINVRSGLKHMQQDVNGNWIERLYKLPVSINSQITALHEDRFENIWIGTMGNGAFILDPKNGKFRKLTEDSMLRTASVLSIAGRNGDIWIASLEGAVNCRQEDGNSNIDHPLRFNDFTDINGIGTNYIYNIYVDKKSRAWFATDGKGISMYENGKFTNYNQEQGLKSEVVYKITEDKKGNIWFTTFNGGVVKFDGKQFTHLGLAEGLSDLNITSLTADKNGNIYVCHKNGIDIISGENESLSYLDREQGLRDVNTDLNTLTTDHEGNVYFVGNNYIHRYTATSASSQPKVVIDRVQLFLNDIEVKDGYRFSSGDNNISFYYTGLYYSQPNKIQYQYKLEGFGQDWITTNDRRRDFPKLPPGDYTFKVRASLNNNFTNAPESTFSFSIQKPLWMRWWFIGLCLLIVSGFLYWYIKDREKRLQKWERLEKATIQSQFETLRNQVNPHFLFNSFNTLISEIEEDPKRAVQYVEHMADFFRSIVTYREKDIIPLQEELGIIKDYLFIQQKRYGKAFNVHINISQAEQQQYYLAPLTLQLLAENAIKHNSVLKEKPLSLEIFVESDQLIVRNNINPKLHQEKSAGMGLQNIYKRYELLTGKAVSVSNDGEYFTVIIPLITKPDGTNTDNRR